MSDASESAKSVLDLIKLYYTSLLPDLLGIPALNFLKNVGSWDLNFGDTQQSFVGSRFVYAFGSDSRVVFSPFSWAVGRGRRNPVMDFLLGQGDDVSFCYGARITATYGGPLAVINRAPRITKTGNSVDVSGLIRNPLMVANEALDQFEVPPSDEAIASRDEKVLLAVKILGVCLSLSTALIDLWVHYKYQEYDPKTGKWAIKQDKAGDLATELGALQIVHRYLPRRLMALIYHVETSSTWLDTADSLKSFLKTTAKKLVTLLVICSLGLALPLAAGMAFNANKKVMWALAILTLVLVILVAVIALVALL